MQHGLLLLSRIIDLEASTRNDIRFQQAPVEYPHLIALDNCRNLVYLRVWDESDMTRFDRDTLTLTLATSAKLYAGQTNNMSIRMASDQGYLVAMGIAKILLCFQHDIHKVYHKDALEVALIAYIGGNCA